MQMIRYHFTDNESYWQMVITTKIHWGCLLRAGIDLLLTTHSQRSNVTQLFGHYQDRVIRLWAKFGLDTWMPCRKISSLPVWRPPEVKGHQIVWMSPEWCHESTYQVWLWYVKEMLRTGLLPVWLLCRQVWLAVTAKRFWIWESCWTHLFNLVWRSYMPRFMKIGHNLWPVEMYNWFWQLSTWRPSSEVAMRNDL